MYIGHIILIAVLAAVLSISYAASKKKAFIYACRGISILFLLVSLLYCYDVFIVNPTSEGYQITWTMYFLAQNEDFLSRNGKFFGLFWGIGIAFIASMLSVISCKRNNKNCPLK